MGYTAIPPRILWNYLRNDVIYDPHLRLVDGMVHEIGFTIFLHRFTTISLLANNSLLHHQVTKSSPKKLANEPEELGIFSSPTWCQSFITKLCLWLWMDLASAFAGQYPHELLWLGLSDAHLNTPEDVGNTFICNIYGEYHHIWRKFIYWDVW